MIWLEEYHINKYVKKYDARVEGRYLNPPKIRSDFQIGDRVTIIPQGRFRLGIDWKHIGKIAEIIRFSDNKAHPVAGRGCELRFFDRRTPNLYIREINLKRRLDKSIKQD